MESVKSERDRELQEEGIEIKEAQQVFNEWFYQDQTEECQEFITQFETLLDENKIYSQNDDGSITVLKNDDPRVVSFLKSDEVLATKDDVDMFNYFFETLDKTNEWISYYDEPTRKLRYKYEEGSPLVSCLLEATIEAPMMHVLALFCEIDLFKNWFPNMTSCDVIKEITYSRGLYQCKQAMPWPMWPREMTFNVSGLVDKKNKAILTVMKTTQDDSDSKYFGVQVPKTSEGHVKLDIKRGYHYFQRIDENTTRYVEIFNTDPQLQLAPYWFMNYMMTKICYQLLVMIQEQAKLVPTNEFGERIRNTRRDFYQKLEETMEKLKETDNQEAQK